MRPVKALISLGCLVALFLAAPAAAQAERELRAQARLFPEITVGVNAMARDTAGRYYVLLRGTSVLMFDAQGTQLGQIPPAGSTPLAYGADLDVTCPSEPGAACLVFVADRAANAVKVYSSAGDYLGSIPVAGPTSVAGLPGNEVAVATLKAPRLVQVFNAEGKLAREFGDPAEVADGGELNRFLNTGRLATDAEGHIYYSFAYVPEPTVRKYDRFGYAALEIELASLDFYPTAQAARRAIAQRESRESRSASLKMVISAIGVGPREQDVWIASGGVLIHFDPDGRRRGTYRIFTAEGARIEAVAILVEPERLLVASETLGVFEFPRPDKTSR